MTINQGCVLSKIVRQTGAITELDVLMLRFGVKFFGTGSDFHCEELRKNARSLTVAPVIDEPPPSLFLASLAFLLDVFAAFVVKDGSVVSRRPWRWRCRYNCVSLPGQTRPRSIPEAEAP
jgi:hypothetical protein